MSVRALIVVAVLASVAVALAVIGQRPPARTGPPSGGLVLAGLADALDDVAAVTVVTAGGETAVTIERGDGGWAVAERGGYPADVNRLRNVLVALSEARIIERKTADPALHDRIGVEDVALESARGLLVRVAGAAGAEHALILGDSDRADERYARRPGEAQSFLMNADPAVARSPAEWIAPEIVDIAGARVASVTIRHTDGAALALTKPDPSAAGFSVSGIPEGRELSSPTVANATGAALRDLRLEDVARFAPDAAGEPVATITYSTFDGLDIDVEAYSIDGQSWLVFDAAANDAADAEAAREADTITERTAGWRYRIPSHRYGQMTRRIEDLLAPADE